MHGWIVTNSRIERRVSVKSVTLLHKILLQHGELEIDTV